MMKKLIMIVALIVIIFAGLQAMDSNNDSRPESSCAAEPARLSDAEKFKLKQEIWTEMLMVSPVRQLEELRGAC